MFPQIKLAVLFTQMAMKHGNKILHANNPDLLTKDLGAALKNQKEALSDATSGMAMTAYNVFPLIVEVKILTLAVARQLEIPTKGKSDIAILEEILAKSEERNGGKYAKDIKGTLEWTRELFANPEIQDVLKMEMTAIEKPTSIRDITTFMKQLVGRSQDELTRVDEFLKKAKQAQKPADKKPQPPKTGL